MKKFMSRREQLPAQFEAVHQMQSHAWIGWDRAARQRVFIKTKPSRIPFSLRFWNEVLLYRKLDRELGHSHVLRIPRLLYTGRRHVFVLEYVPLSDDAKANRLLESSSVRRAFLDGLVRFNSALRSEGGVAVHRVAGLIHSPVQLGISLALRNRRLLGNARIMRSIRVLRLADSMQRPVKRYLLHNDIKIRHNWALDDDDRLVIFDLERAGLTRKWALFDVISAAYDPAFPADLDFALVDGLLNRMPGRERHRIVVPCQIAVGVALRAIARTCSQPEPKWLQTLDGALEWIEGDILEIGRRAMRGSPSDEVGR
jgi:hypothetical protein